MHIRTAILSDLDAISAVEAEYFPVEEAATRDNFEARLKVYPDHFWILEEDDGKIVSFINGMVTNELTISDEMFENPLLHDKDGSWQAIFGVNAIPCYRKRGLAAKLMNYVIQDARNQGRKGCILTCKKELIAYYENLDIRI